MRAQAEALEAEAGEDEDVPPETEGSTSVKRRFNNREMVVRPW